jgi:hypothetical protein
MQGRILGNGAGECHLVAWFTSVDSKHPDGYSLSCVCSSSEQLNSGIVCGVWVGTTSWRNEDPRFLPYSGIVVISPEKLGHEQLNALAMNYRDRYGIHEPLMAAGGILSVDGEGAD